MEWEETRKNKPEERRGVRNGVKSGEMEAWDDDGVRRMGCKNKYKSGFIQLFRVDETCSRMCL